MKSPWFWGVGSQAPNTVPGNYTANCKLFWPVSLAISIHFLRTSCPGLTNRSLQSTWFLSSTTGKFPNVQTKYVQTTPTTHTTPSLNLRSTAVWDPAKHKQKTFAYRIPARQIVLQTDSHDQGPCEDCTAVHPSKPTNTWGEGRHENDNAYSEFL